MTTRQTIDVALGTRSYQVVIGSGLFNDIASFLSPVVASGCRLGLVYDEQVGAIYKDQLSQTLEKAGYKIHPVSIPVGETSKSFSQLEKLCAALLQSQIERKDALLALGGGVVGDLTGFAASILRRGVPVIQLPTSLLAQVDSSVGGKTGINTPHGKNLIGAFHQPALVLADTDSLSTLSARHMRAGYAEIVKYGLLGDFAFFNWLESNAHDIFTGGSARIEAVARSVKAKAGVVSRDETEQGERALLNLGHTFGHALEAVTGYSQRLYHGEAVSIGMVLAMKFSHRLGWLDGQSVTRATSHLDSLSMPTRLDHIPGEKPDCDSLIKAMMQDKKVTSGQIRLILLRALGKAEVVSSVTPDEIRAFLLDELSTLSKA